MKKVLLSLVAAAASAFFASAETVTFDFATPSTWGYEAKAGAGADYTSQKPIVEEPVTIAVDTKTAVTGGGMFRFWFPAKETTAKDFRCSSKGGILGQTLTFSADGNTITEIKFTAAKFALTANVGDLSAWENGTATWTGSATEVVFTTTEANTLNNIIVTYENSGDMREPAGLAWTESSVTVLTTEIADFTAPALTNPNNVDVTYASDNAEVATVSESGVAALTGAKGSVTITATFAGNQTYRAQEVSYTIRVKAPIPVNTSSLEKPYTVEEALAIVVDLDGTTLADVYVKGVVGADPSLSASHGNMDYNILDTPTSTSSLLIYRGKYFDGESFNVANQLVEGDEVIVKGSLLSYNGKPQITSNSVLVSLNGSTTPPAIASTEVNSIAETIALADGTPIKVNYPLTVAYVSGDNIFVCDAEGDFIQLYGSNSLKAGDVIPAGWEGSYTVYSGNTPEITFATGALPEATEGTFTPATVAASAISPELVNHVVTVANVDFESATPATKKDFTGTCGETTLNFYNNYTLASVEAGKYNVTGVVVIRTVNSEPVAKIYVTNYVISETDGVEAVEAEDNAAPVEYYNLQGMRVDKPANGIFIRRQGSTTRKVVL
ncbi:MAG: hypothetical protein OSJ37_00165 [Muribaculaceae bacterium]|nr:hypothetical protein [Muribaculaceae bacterium]